MNWSEFFAMGGYAVYIWGAYVVTLAVVVVEVVLLILRRRNILRFLGRSRQRASTAHDGGGPA
jgi:heme exporter protein D